MNSAAKLGLLLAVPAVTLFSNEPAPALLTGSYPPPSAPVELAPTAVEARLNALATVYSIGDPTAEEQLYIELVNRARANPQAEAQILANTTDPIVQSYYRSFSVDLGLLVSQFSGIAAAPPLAPNAKLQTAARRHTLDMLNNAFQEHQGTDGTQPFNRVQQAGYNILKTGENIYANAESVFHGHAGFEVDWGPGTGGMQTPPGHRLSIHDASYREIGVAVLSGSNTRNGFTVGPQLVTEEFATAQAATPFITGVVYYDLNGNNFYDPGEGIGGASLKVNGVATEAVTALSGGYAVPVPGNGSYTLTLSGSGFASVTRNVIVTSGFNQKADFTPAYSAPTISGPASPGVGRANAYTISTVGGASAYEWQSFEKIVARSEGAENGTANVTVQQSSGYEVIQSPVKSSGSFAFHMVHPQSGAVPQAVTLKSANFASANSTLRFQSRLGWAGPAQAARVQISTDGGSSWSSVYSQSGTGNSGEQNFTLRLIDLGAYAGRQIRVRFLYDITPGSYFPQTNDGVGWYVDDIAFSNVEEVTNAQTGAATNGAFQFRPEHAGNYVLLARARTGHNFLDWGPAKAVQAVVSTTPEFRIGSVVRGGTELQIFVDLSAGVAGTFTLESKARVTDAWTAEPATVQPITATRYVLRLPLPGSAPRFFRVKST